MFKNKYFIPASDLNQEVKKILEIPPNWTIRNGGFLMLSYVILIYIMFTMINVSPILFSRIEFGEIINSNRHHSISANLRMDKRDVVALKKGAEIHLIVQNGKKKIRYLAKVQSIQINRDLALISLVVPEISNMSQFRYLQSSKRFNCSIELAKVNIMSTIFHSHLGKN